MEGFNPPIFIEIIGLVKNPNELFGQHNTLNMSSPNMPVKRQRLSDWIKKEGPILCGPQETHFKYKAVFTGLLSVIFPIAWKTYLLWKSLLRSLCQSQVQLYSGFDELHNTGGLGFLPHSNVILCVIYIEMLWYKQWNNTCVEVQCLASLCRTVLWNSHSQCRHVFKISPSKSAQEGLFRWRFCSSQRQMFFQVSGNLGTDAGNSSVLILSHQPNPQTGFSGSASCSW